MDECAILAEELQDENVRDRRRAAKMLALLAEESQPAAVALLHAVNDPDETVRNWVTEALENLGPPRPSDADTLANLACHSAEADTQYFALVLLGRLRQQGAGCFDLLLELEHQPMQLTTTVRSQLLKTLAKVAPEDQKAVLITRLQVYQNSAEPELQRLSTRLLAELSSP